MAPSIQECEEMGDGKGPNSPFSLTPMFPESPAPSHPQTTRKRHKTNYREGDADIKLDLY